MQQPVDAPLSVLCLCAQWCGTCRQYAQDFAALQQEFPQLHWQWVDVEEQADALGDWEIETFPTVLLGRGEQPVFMGVLPPHRAVLQRLVQQHSQAGAAPVGVDAQVQALWQRLRP